jgi:putative endopeptidase
MGSRGGTIDHVAGTAMPKAERSAPLHDRLWVRVKTFLIACAVAVTALSPLAVVQAQDLPGQGVSLADMDLAADPAVDFYRYANGGWLDRTTIPDDFPSIETMSALDGQTRLQLVNLLIERANSGEAEPGSDEWKAIEFYGQGIDVATRNAQGIEPIEPLLELVAAIDTTEDLHQFLQESVFLSMPGLFFVSAGPDMTNSAETVAYLDAPSFGLPTRDYYLLGQDDPSIDAVRDAYLTTSTELLTLIGRDPAEAARAARAVYDFEAALAEPTLSPEESQDYSLLANATPLAELTEKYPLMDWPAYMAALGLEHVSELVLLEPRYMTKLDAIVRDTPLEVIKDFLTLQLLYSSAASLSEEMEATTFAYFGGALSGVSVQAPVEGRTFDQVNYFLGDAVGKLYVEAYFSPTAKARSEELVREIVEAFRARLERNAWMTAETKANALAKLAALKIKVGYPDEWRDYGEVEILNSYFGTALSAFNVYYRENLSQIGSPVDREEWPFPPQTVNAMYNPLNNEIIIPAAILQAPLFDAQADPASNFGAIGYIIGHEITHGFDVAGSQFDGEGNLANWWTDADYTRFAALNERLVDQYSEIEATGGAMVDGQLTLDENVADLGGIQVAYDALQLHLERHGRPAPDIEAAICLSQEQRFFIAAATVWRAETRAEALQTQLMADTHAPATVRATQPLRNSDAFYEAFDIGPDDPMYLGPEERIVIW